MAKLEERMAKSEERMDRFDRRTQAIQKLVATGMRMLVKIEEAQRRSDRKFERLIDLDLMTRQVERARVQELAGATSHLGPRMDANGGGSLVYT